MGEKMRMKKMGKLGFLSLIMVFLGMVSFASATIDISIPDMGAGPGTTVQIPINLEDWNGTAPTVGGFQFTVTYDNSVIEDTPIVTAGSLTGGWTILPNTGIEGQVTIGGFSLTGFSSGTGSLCVMEFTVNGNVGDATNLNFTVCTLSDTGGQPIPTNSINGSLSVGYSISGTLTYAGTETGKTAYIGVFDNANFEGEPVVGGMIEDFTSGDGYTVAGLANGTYYVGAYLDINDNDDLDPIDPFGAYGAPTAVVITDSNVTEKNITLVQPDYDKYRGYGIVTGPDAEIFKDNLYLFADGTFFFNSETETETGTGTGTWAEDDDGKGFITFQPSDGEGDGMTGYKKAGMIIVNETWESNSISSELEIFILDDGTNFTPADVNSTSWNVINIISGENNGWQRGAMIVTAGGNYTYAYEDCQGGGEEDTGTVSIDAAGVITVDGQEIGIMAGNKRLVVCGGIAEVPAGSLPEANTYFLTIMSKRGTGFNAAKLSDTYTIFEITTSDNQEVTESKRITYEVGGDLNFESLEKNWLNKLLYTRGTFEFVVGEDSFFEKTENPYNFGGAGVVIDASTSLIGYARLNPIGGCAVGIGISGPDYTTDKNDIAEKYEDFMIAFNAEADLTDYFSANFLHAGIDRAGMIAWLTGDEGPDSITSITELNALIIQDRALTRFKITFVKDTETFAYNIALDDMNYLVDIPDGSWYLSGNGFNSSVTASSGIEGAEYFLDFDVEAEGESAIQHDATVIVNGPSATDYHLWISGNGDSAYGETELVQAPLIGSVYTFRVHYTDGLWETIQDSIENVMNGVTLSALAPTGTIADTTPQFSFDVTGTANEPLASAYAIDIAKDMGDGEAWVGSFENGTLEEDKTYVVDYDDLTEVAEGYETGLIVGENYILEAEVFDIFGNYASGTSEFNLENPVLTVISEYGSPDPEVGEHSYPYDTSVTASVNSPLIPATQHVCTGWTGTGSVPPTGTTNEVTFNLQENSTLTWNWKTQHYLTVESAQDDPQGEGWYDEGTTANWSVTSPADGEPGTRYVADPAGGSELMDEPKEVIVDWTTQYQLTINTTGQGTVTPATGNWYNTGTEVTLTATPADGWLFDHWEGDLIGETNPDDITMDSAKTVTAVFVLNAPQLQVAPTTAEFLFNIGALREDTTQETQITISNIGAAGTLNWIVGTIIYQQGIDWIRTYLPVQSGSLEPGEDIILMLEVDRAGLNPGIYIAEVPIESNGGNQSIIVTMRIYETPNTPTPVYPTHLEEDVLLDTWFEIEVPQATNGENEDEIIASQWQISTQDGEGFESRIIFDETKISDEWDTIKIPYGLLTTDTTYYWRVKVQELFGESWSEWGGPWSFTTSATDPAEDAYKSPAEKAVIETAIGETLDFAFSDSTDSETVGVKSEDGTLTMVKSTDPDEFPDENKPTLLPFGVFGFRLEDVTEGETATVKFFVPGDYTTYDWHKYNPTTGWFKYNDGRVTKTFANGYTEFEIRILDNGEGDFDKTLGVIVDPAGPGGSPGGNGGGGGWCFIATAAYGTPMAEEVVALKEFRDEHLLTNKAGKAFVRFYYKHSPGYADFIRNKPALRAIVRTGLKPLLWISKIF